MKRPDLAPTSVSITLGGGVRLSMTTDNDLIVEDDFVRMSLGRGTKARFRDIRTYLDRLSTHAVNS